MTNRFPRCAAFVMTVLVLAGRGVCAQEIEPRSYSNTPVGLNFLIAGYGYTEGKIAFDPSLPIADAQYRNHTDAVAYARSLNAWGNSAKIDVILPYSSFSGQALVSGLPREREMTGFGDPRFRFSMNFYGAPALKEFANYRQDVIVGASLQVTAPLGQYDNSKVLNIGNNRWSFRPELGVSKALGPWTLEVAPSVTLYTDNTDFNNGKRFEQAPLYAVQGHIIYGFASGIWIALNGLYSTGGRTTVNGLRGDNMQTNSRVGVTVALPVDRHNAVKLNASTGTSTRTGSDFNLVGIAWQYRWGAGY
ncbi:MAG TPA: transporter [Verrucomicrobiales bacterium]|nr:transporter [Verrucomicrobiales bacterium]